MSSTESKLRFYPESRFGGFTDVDGTLVFYSRVHALLPANAVILDVGCGRGEYGEDPVAMRRQLRILIGRYGRVIGLDVDEAGRTNPYIDEFHLLKDDLWPIPDASIDLCLADFVMEHVADPDAFLAEANRVLRPGGHLCIRTTNGWGYVALAARIVRNRDHARVLQTVQEDRKAADVFPTLYRCNSVGKLRRAMERRGFEAVVYGYEAEPSYLSFSTAVYFLGVLHQRLCPSRFRNTLFAFGRKPSA